jgi:hypothetical protein
MCVDTRKLRSRAKSLCCGLSTETRIQSVILHHFATLLKFTFDDSPRVLPSSDLFAVDLKRGIAGNDGEGDTFLQFLVLLLELIVLIRVAVRKLVDLSTKRD